jgi:HSP20 family molecular chaperone IbpA
MKVQSEVMGMVKQLSRRLSTISLDEKFKQRDDVETQGYALQCDLTETPDSFQMTVDLPGCRLKDIDVRITDNFLTVRADRRADSGGKGHHAMIVERACGKVERTLELPSAVNPDSVEKKLKNGVLRIIIGKRSADPK